MRALIVCALVVSTATLSGGRAFGDDTCTFLAASVRALAAQNARFPTASTQAALDRATSDYNASCGGPPQPPQPQPQLEQPVVPAAPVGDFAADSYLPDGSAMQEVLDWAAFRRALAPRYDAATARARGGPLEDVTLPPVPVGGVPVGSGALKLCWQLFSRTDCTDQEAVATYQERSQTVIARLQAERAVVAAQRADIERHSRLFEGALKSQKLGPLVDALRDDQAMLMQERDDALTGAIGAILGAVPSAAPNAGSAASTYLLDAPLFAATLRQKVASGERWTTEDTETAANLAAGVATDLADRALEGTARAAGATFVGRGVAAGQAAIALAEAGTAEYALQQADLAILKPTEAIEQQRAVLASDLFSTELRSNQLSAELAWRQDELRSVLQYSAGR